MECALDCVAVKKFLKSIIKGRSTYSRKVVTWTVKFFQFGQLEGKTPKFRALANQRKSGCTKAGGRQADKPKRLKQ